MRTFDFYEYAGIIVPGAVLLLGSALLWPDLSKGVLEQGATFGDLGIFLIASYAVGQLVQGVGNALEWLLWRPFGGLPNRKLLNGQMMPKPQYERLVTRLHGQHILTHTDKVLSESEARYLTREVYTRVSSAGRAARLETFNGNYGLVRGLAASLLLIVVAAVGLGVDTSYVGVLAVAFVLALQRMYRFGVHYTRELFLTYLSLDG